MHADDRGHAQPFIAEPGRGRAVPLLGMWHRVDAQHLDGRLLVMEGVIEPGQLILPHTHTREDECAYVVSGELTYQLGEDVRLVTEGSYVVKPRGIPHAFWNASAESARVVEMHVPATLGCFYDELAAIFGVEEPGTPGWRQAFGELNDRFGIVQHWDRVADISRRYGVGPGRS